MAGMGCFLLVNMCILGNTCVRLNSNREMTFLPLEVITVRLVNKNTRDTKSQGCFLLEYVIFTTNLYNLSLNVKICLIETVHLV